MTPGKGKTRREHIRMAGGLFVLWLLLCSTVLSAKSLSLAVFPYFSPEQLVTLHKPLKDYLARATGVQIHLVSAPDFKTFKQRTAAGRYDLLITAPHLGRLAEKRAGYRWLAVTSNCSEAVFVARRDSGLGDITELKGHRLALPARLAIIHQMALEALEQRGLQPGQDVTVVTHKSHDQALYATILGETDAAAVGRPTWQRYRAPKKRDLIVIGRSDPIPGFAIMAHSRLSDATIERLQQALYHFASTPEGKAYFDATGLEGLRPITEQDLALLDHYLARIRAAREANQT